MKISMQIKIAVKASDWHKRFGYEIKAAMRRIRHLEAAVANINPVKQVLEAIKKEAADPSKNIYDS